MPCLRGNVSSGTESVELGMIKNVLVLMNHVTKNVLQGELYAEMNVLQTTTSQMDTRKYVGGSV